MYVRIRQDQARAHGSNSHIHIRIHTVTLTMYTIVTHLCFQKGMCLVSIHVHHVLMYMYMWLIRVWVQEIHGQVHPMYLILLSLSLL